MNNLSLLVTFIFKHLVNKVLLLLLINYYWLKNNEIFTLFTPQKNSQYFKILLQKSSTTYTHRMSTWNGGLSVFCESFRKYLLLSLLCRSARVLLGHLDLVTLHYYRQLSSSTSFAAGVVQSLNHVSLQPQELLHAKLPFPPLSPRVCSNSCPLSQWCYPTISSSVVPFSSCPQSFPASGSFPMSQFLPSGGQCIGTLASASVLPMNIQGWFSLGWTGLISLQSKGLSRVFSSTTIRKHQFFSTQPYL